jgi:hypothetical protein
MMGLPLLSKVKSIANILFYLVWELSKGIKTIAHENKFPHLMPYAIDYIQMYISHLGQSSSTVAQNTLKGVSYSKSTTYAWRNAQTLRHAVPRSAIGKWGPYPSQAQYETKTRPPRRDREDKTAHNNAQVVCNGVWETVSLFSKTDRRS